MRKIALMVAAAVLLSGASFLYLQLAADADRPTWRLARVERGLLVSTVSASGTVNAVVTVQVGSQVSGQIRKLLADFNSEVRAGQVIARLDPATFEARLAQTQAELALAHANVKLKQAAVERVQAMLAEAGRDLERKRSLRQRGAVAASQLDQAKALYDQTRAQLSMAEAETETATAQVRQQEAAVEQSRIDLERTIIRSPVDGVIISRNVDVGQTVAASLQAPILFLIAQDLRNIQVEVRVDEADIGRLQVGQEASFTVDSFPNRVFQGRVEQIRKAPLVVQNVVTYTVLVSDKNPDQRLLPGLTADVRITVESRPDVLKVPNAALRFRPPAVAESGAAAATKESRMRLQPAERTTRTPPRGQVWLPGTNGVPQAIEIVPGLTDGGFTEIVQGNLDEGQPVIVGTGKSPARQPGGARIGF